ncbi:MAG: flavodoxin family protein [Chloroflexi bacterium]|nr:flavodoxin family protein [Chloroflexota bacterium]
MIPVAIKLLGISGTPIKGGNCDTMVQQALASVQGIPGVETEFITLADKKIAMCQHCQWCIENRAPCKVKDDAHSVFEKMIAADGLILGTPVWNVSVAPIWPTLISRWRYHQFFTYSLRNKVSGTLSVGFLGLGMERALEDLEIVGRGAGFVVARGWAIASKAAFGQRPAYLDHGVLDDKAGMTRVYNVATKVVEISRMVKYATEAGVTLPEEYVRTFRGTRLKDKEEKVLVDGVWRDKK